MCHGRVRWVQNDITDLKELRSAHHDWRSDWGMILCRIANSWRLLRTSVGGTQPVQSVQSVQHHVGTEMGILGPVTARSKGPVTERTAKYVSYGVFRYFRPILPSTTYVFRKKNLRPWRPKKLLPGPVTAISRQIANALFPAKPGLFPAAGRNLISGKLSGTKL